MQYRNAYLYLRTFDFAAFELLTNDMQQIGFELLNPETKKITAIREASDVEDEANDWISDHMPVSREWLQARLHNRVRTSLLWFREDWTSLFFYVDFVQAGVELMLELNAVVGEDYEPALVDLLLTQFKTALTSEKALGLVIDPDAFTEEFEWSNFFFETARFDGALPRILAVPIQKLEQLVTNTSQARTETLKDFVIFYSEYDLPS